MSSDKQQESFQRPGQQQPNWAQKGPQQPKPQGQQPQHAGQGAPSNRPASSGNFGKK